MLFYLVDFLKCDSKQHLAIIMLTFGTIHLHDATRKPAALQTSSLLLYSVSFATDERFLFAEDKTAPTASLEMLA